MLDETPHEVTIPENGKMVFLSIENDPASGAIEINKVDAETSEPLAGVHFILKDSAGAVVKEGSTDNDGKLSFAGLALGDYTLTETVAKDGYVLGSTPIIVTLSSNGQTVTKEIRNTRAVGSVEVEKADAETGKPLPGVHFKLLDAAGEVIREGGTGEDGKLSFSGLPLGSYSLVETETAEGYVPDETARPISITENGQLVQVKVENTPIRAPLKVVKKDAHENTPLAGAGYQLLDATGTKIAEGYTDENGELTINGVAIGYRLESLADYKAQLEALKAEASADPTPSASASAEPQYEVDVTFFTEDGTEAGSEKLELAEGTQEEGGFHPFRDRMQFGNDGTALARDDLEDIAVDMRRSQVRGSLDQAGNVHGHLLHPVRDAQEGHDDVRGVSFLDRTDEGGFLREDDLEGRRPLPRSGG